MPVPKLEDEELCICLLGISISPLFLHVPIRFRTVLPSWYFLFLYFYLTKQIKIVKVHKKQESVLYRVKVMFYMKIGRITNRTKMYQQKD